MGTEWNEFMVEIWECRKEIKRCLKELKKQTKEHDVKRVRNSIAWIRATCEAMIVMCDMYEAESK